MDGVLILNRPKRALVAYSMSSTFVQTTLDYLLSFKQFSGFDVSFVHVTHGAVIGFDLEQFDIVFHSYCARLCFDGYVSDDYRQKLKEFSGLKVLSVQDEYDRTDVLKAAIKDLGFHIILTCVPQESIDYVYPSNQFPSAEFITVFTGYVSDNFVANRPSPKPLSERPIFIGYRGRDIGGRYGRLGFDKFEIGRRTKELCDAREIQTDIAMDEASRIYGAAWFDFVGNCRAMLGSESGSNVFDFDGSIEARFKEMAAANGGFPPSYAEFLPFVTQRDGEIEMGQISPRIFECAIMRTAMVLFKGRYSDALQPDVHYISLEKDFSNFDLVLSKLNDVAELEAMTSRAFDHLVDSGQFTYRAFYRRVAASIASRLAEHPDSIPVRIDRKIYHVDSISEDGNFIELPSDVPFGLKNFEIRHMAKESVTFRNEFDILLIEFGRLRDLFDKEIHRLNDSFQSLLDRTKALADERRIGLPSWSLADCEFMILLDIFDAEMAIFVPRRQTARSAFNLALASGDEEACHQNTRAVLDIEKDGYFRMIEWIRRLNESYDASRLAIGHAYQDRVERLNAKVPTNLLLRQKMRLVPMIIRSRARGLIIKLVRTASRFTR